MEMSYRSWGKTPQTCFEKLTTEPWEVVRLLESYCRFHLSGSQTALRALDGPRDPKDTFEACVGLGGAARVGPWCHHGPLLHPEASIVLHWPTLLRNVDTLVATFPPGIFLLGMFLPLVARKTRVGAEFLRRTLLKQTDILLLSEIHDRPGWLREYPDLPQKYTIPHPEYPHEQSFYGALGSALADDPAFVRSLRHSVTSTFSSWASVSSEKSLIRRYRELGYLGDSVTASYHGECNVLRPGKICDPVQQPPRVLREAVMYRAYKEKFRPKTHSFVAELLCALEMGTPWVDEPKESWRARVGALGASWFGFEGNDYLAVDWGRWYSYRVATTGSFFREDIRAAVEKEKEAQGKDAQGNSFLSPQALRAVILRRLHRLYPPGRNTLLLSPGIVLPPPPLLRAWATPKDTIGAVEVSIIPTALLDIKAYRQLAREQSWSGVLKRTTKKEANPNKKRRAYTPLEFTLHLVVGGERGSVSIAGFHKGRTVYFRVPGSYTREMFISQKGPIHLRSNRKLPKGVVMHKDAFHFTAGFIKEHRTKFASLTDVEVEQIEAFGAQSRAEVLQYNRRLGKKVQVGRPTKFTKDQDNAIIIYYRPKMTDSDVEQLLTACRGLPPSEVHRRAKFLRSQLIWEEGITDIDDLPHQRRTEGMLKEIRDAIAQQNKNKPKQGVNNNE